jgi:hypothetical protein
MSIAINTANEVPFKGRELNRLEKYKEIFAAENLPNPNYPHEEVVILNFVNLKFSYETVYFNYSAGPFFYGDFCPG